MLTGFEHVGMTVSNLDACIGFYVDLLGLRLVVRRTGQDGNEMAFLDTGNGMLEVFSAATGALRAEDVPAGRAGVRHLTFAFESVDAIYGTLADAGVDLVEAPRDAHNTDILKRVAFCRDPDGILIELVEH